MHVAWMLGLHNCLPTSGLSSKPLKVKLLAGEQKATEVPEWVMFKIWSVGLLQTGKR